MIFQLDDDTIHFPNPTFAEPDGLLAIGGDLKPERLLAAYRKGIFPWYDDNTPILWYSPHKRFVIFPEELKISKSMQQVIRSGKFHITFNNAFSDVITACASLPRRGQDGTWITPDMQEAYIHLHQLGKAHSVETWHEGKLVGGLYGVTSGQVFCGESMFSQLPNASKIALIKLCQTQTYRLIDCQVHTDHLASMGARMIPRSVYQDFLTD